MLKVREPFWNRASLLCLDASVKKGSRTFAIPANGGHRPDHHHITQLSSGLSAFEGSVGSKKKIFFPAKNPVDARREPFFVWEWGKGGKLFVKARGVIFF